MKIICECSSMKKTAAVTGATSGIGRCIARMLRKMGFDLLITGRNCRELERLCRELGKEHVTAVSADLSVPEECIEFHRISRNYPVCVLVNNAGFGIWGRFSDVSLKDEMKMLDLNVRAVHILTKLFLEDFLRRDRGYILNVSSAAAFMPGPLMSGYYASKAYVLRQAQSISAELKKSGSHVKISVLCPGPVDTDFNRRAGVKGSFRGISPEYAARAGIKGMFSGKTIIIPSLKMKAVCAAAGIIPPDITAAVNYCIQKRKNR